jgi:hypothetical protein
MRAQSILDQSEHRENLTYKNTKNISLKRKWRIYVQRNHREHLTNYSREKKTFDHGQTQVFSVLNALRTPETIEEVRAASKSPNIQFLPIPFQILLLEYFPLKTEGLGAGSGSGSALRLH